MLSHYGKHLGTAFVFNDTNDVVDAWYNIFNGVVNEHLPLKQKCVKRSAQPKWFDKNINQEIKARGKLFKEQEKVSQNRIGQIIGMQGIR